MGRPKRVLEIDTRSLADAYGASIEIVPINSGNTNYAAVRRGNGTFAPLISTDYGPMAAATRQEAAGHDQGGGRALFDP